MAMTIMFPSCIETTIPLSFIASVPGATKGFHFFVALRSACCVVEFAVCVPQIVKSVVVVWIQCQGMLERILGGLVVFSVEVEDPHVVPDVAVAWVDAKTEYAVAHCLVNSFCMEADIGERLYDFLVVRVHGKGGLQS